jgi:hypothetical protein
MVLHLTYLLSSLDAYAVNGNTSRMEICHRVRNVCMVTFDMFVLFTELAGRRDISKELNGISGPVSKVHKHNVKM